MTDKYNAEYLEVGDSFEGGPIEQSYFISAVMAAGGEIEIDGDVVTILQLPKAKSEAKAPESPKAVEEAPKEEPKEEAKEEVKEEPKEEAPKPKSGPKSKAHTPEAEKE